MGLICEAAVMLDDLTQCASFICFLRPLDQV